MLSFVARFAAAALLVAAPLLSHAQSYPRGAVTLLVPYVPGGITDVLARIVADRLTQKLGVPVVAENRSGAGGTIAAQAAARSKPDGQTLLMHSSAILPVALSLPDSTFDPMKELSPVAFVAGLPSVLTVHPSGPANTMAELLAWLRANPAVLRAAVEAPDAWCQGNAERVDVAKGAHPRGDGPRAGSPYEALLQSLR